MKALLVALVVLACSARVAAALCNTADGNIGEHNGVNYNAVLLGSVGVCLSGTFATQAEVQYGMNAWNSVTGFGLMWNTCSYTGVFIKDWPQGMCAGKPACAELPSGEVTQVLTTYLTPMYSDLDAWNKQCVMTHEFGHNLGFAHASSGSVMVTPCAYNWTTPVDEANYYEAYWVDPVTNLHGSSSSPGEVSLGWNQVNSEGELLCNEAGFNVYNDSLEASVGQSVTSVSLDGQPPNWQTYTVRGRTGALLNLQGQASTRVDVDGLPFVIHLFLFGPAPVEIDDTSGRYMWAIGEVENPTNHEVQVDLRSYRSGSLPIGCYETQQPILPGVERIPLAPREAKWILYRTRFECYYPATPTTRSFHVYLCISEVGSGIEDCHDGGSRTFIVQ